MPNLATQTQQTVYHPISHQPIDNQEHLLSYEHEHALIGVSPFNSYSSVENMEKLFAWGLDNARNMHIFIPDQIYTYTFQALGYPLNKAEQKTRKQDNYLKNKVIKALENNGLNKSDIEKRIIFLSQLKSNKEYIEMYNLCLDLFEHNEIFRQGCIDISQWIINSKGIPAISINQEVINTAVKYFLAELPLFLNTSEILKISSSVFIYHDIPKFLKSIYKHKYFISSGQSFIKINFND